MADTSVSEEYVGTFQVTTGTGAPVDIEVPSDSSSFYFCDQDMVRLKFPHNFPAIPSNQPAGFEWMIPDQNFAYVYGYTCVGILGFVLLILLNKLRKIVKVFFLSPFEVRRVMRTWPLGNFSCPVYFYFYFHKIICFAPTCQLYRNITNQFLYPSSVAFLTQRLMYQKSRLHSIHFPSCFVTLEA